MRLLRAARDYMLCRRCSSVGLGLFRIAYGSVLLGEVLQLIYFRRLVFGDLEILPPPEISFGFVLWAWAVVVACLILGLHTRIACVANYVLSLATLSTFQQYEYHADHIYVGLNLLLIFTPVENRLSLDALRRRIRWGAVAGDSPADTSVARFHCDALLLIGLGLVYLDSFAWKLGEQIWSNGLGVWLPASLPHDTWFSPAILNAVLNHRMLVSVLSDLTLVFEATFIVLMWLRAARPILCVIGLGLHVSIVFAFPIPFFGLSLAALYLLLAPAAWYEAAARAIRRGEPQCVIQFDAGSPRWRRALLILEHFDFRGRLAFRPLDAGDVAQAAGLVVIGGTRQYQGHAGFVAALRCHSLFWPLAGLYGRAVNSFARTTHKQTLRSRSTQSELAAWKPSHPRSSVVLAGASHDLMLYFKFAIVAACTIIQATLIADAPYFRGTHMPSNATPRWLADTRHVFYGYAGICSHGVFLDSHFKDYDHIIAVTWIRPDGSEQWLPLTKANGQVGAYAMGRFWCKWVIRNNGPYMSSELLKSALREVTAFWARKNRVDLADAKFKVLVRKYDPCKGWQPDYLLRQTEKPWTQLGLVQWKDRAYTAQIAEIKRL